VNIPYFASQALKNIHRHAFMSFAEIFIITGCLIMLGAFTLFTANASHLTIQLEELCELQLFVDNKAGDERVKKIADEILSVPNVKSIELFSKDDMLEYAKKDMFGDDTSKLYGFENDNPFSDSYKIILEDISKTNETVEKLNKIRDVDHINNNRDIADYLTKIAGTVKKAGAVFMILLLILSMAIIANTVRITIYNRRKEIRIMLYIGATDSFIKGPYIIEGFIIGTLCGGLAYIIVMGSYIQICHFLSESVFNAFEIISYSGLIWPALGIFFVSGWLIGAVGSALAVKKYLKV